MATLQITTFGRPQILMDGRVVQDIRSAKARAVLYYLAAVGEPTSRQLLAGLFWSDKADESARRNLRGIIYKLKNVGGESILLADRDMIGIDPAVNLSVDIAQFEGLLAEPHPSVEQMSKATHLYRGDFLEDYHIADAPLFDEWVVAQRERLRQQAEQTFYRLVIAYTDRRQLHQGIDSCTRLLELWPWAEEGHRQLMHLFAMDGQRSAALNQYDICSDILYEDLGVEPSDETTALYDQILAGEIGAAPRDRMDVPDVKLVPPFQAMARYGHFVGRQEELQQLSEWLMESEGQSIAALVGMGGIGKSTLANRVAHQLREHYADGVLWANARTADPMDTLLSWAQVYGYDFSGLVDLNNRAAALRSILADKRVLIVLDDVISPSRVRALLPGGPEHAVLMTTRDQDIARALDAKVLPVRELTADDCIMLLSQVIGEERVNAELEAAHAICNELRNLPLAIEITAKRLVDRTTRRLSAMASRLHDVSRRLDELTFSDRAVRASFLVSWESMHADLRQSFALLGLFGGRSFRQALRPRHPFIDRNEWR
jgi:DNA-binding SARP family transcriptional activator